MAEVAKIQAPIGGMDKDSDLPFVSDKDYIDAKNIRHISKDGNDSVSAENIYGNQEVWKAYIDGQNTVNAQNKRIRIAINATTNETVSLVFFTSPNGAPNTTAATFSVVGGNIYTSLDNLVAALQTEWAAAGYGTVVEIEREYTNVNFGSVVVDLGDGATYTGIDFILEFDNIKVTITEIVREAIPVTYTGEAYCIGSFDLLNDLITFWTTQRNLPETRDVIGATNATPIVITESAVHGLVDGDEVVIQGVPTNTNANGKWIVNVLTTTTYELVGSAGNGTAESTINGVAIQSGTGYAFVSTAGAHGLVVGDRVYVQGITGATVADGIYNVVEVFSATEFTIDIVATGGGVSAGTAFRVSGAIHNILGYGMIWVSQKNEATAAWTATRLLASKELNLVTKHQIDCRFEINGGRVEGYFTDDYNSPRVFYYSGAYVQDGAINRNGNGPGIYTYGTISTALMLLSVAPSVDVDVSQLQAGGSLQSGNWRYLVRFSTDNVTFSLVSDPSGPVNVFAANIGTPTGIRGDAENTLTPKVNVITVTGIPSFFDFVELIGVHYVGGGVESFAIRRETLDKTGQIVMYHYGNETTIENFDNSLLFEQRPDIKTALNIETLDQKLTLSNTTAYEHPDLTDWAQEATHVAQRDTLTTLGSNNPKVGYGGASLYGEYQDYDNVENRIGHMMNETYRYGIQLQYKGTDILTPVYWVDDVTFTTGTSGRRTAGLTDFSLTTLSVPTNPPTNATSPEPYVIYPIFTNFDFGYVLPNGKTVAEEFDKIKFVRAERVPTILTTGYACPLFQDAGTYWFTAASTFTGVGGYSLLPAATYAPGVGIGRRLLYTVFPDALLGNIDIDYQAGDQILNFGNPSYQIIREVTILGGNADPASAEMYGDTTVVSGTIESADINQVVYNAGTSAFTLGGQNVAPIVFGTVSDLATYASYYISVDTDLTDVNGVGDYGVYYVQYYRPLADQYGDINSTFYIETGSEYDIDANSSASDTFAVFGGDIFTQKATFGYSYSISAANSYGSFYGMYSQNAVNAQMRQMGNDASNQIALPRGNDPSDDWDTRITETGSSQNRELRAYDVGYNAEYLLSRSAAFDPDVSQNADFSTRIWYSETKAANSLLDSYRVILPLSYRDLATSDGEIFAMLVVNGELYTWQQRAFMRQYFNARATIQGGDDTQDIILGSTAVFSQNGKIISTRGTRHKWSVIKGRSLSGYDTVYWITSELNNAMKFDSAGTGSISDMRKMKSFFANNLRWADGENTPADFFGICGVWNERYGEIIWSIRANATNTVSEWDSTVSYDIGDPIKYASTPLFQKNFEQSGEIYVSKIGGNLNNLPTDTDAWEKISHDDPRWYNEDTIAYCELRNEWESFRSFKPTIFLRWKDKFLTPRPLSNRGFVYEHDRGFIGTWYRQDGEFILTGTIDKIEGTLTVTGVGTALTTELQSGYILFNTYIVNEIISNTEMTIFDVKYDLVSGEYVPATGATADLINVTNAGYSPTQSEMAHLTPVVNNEPNVNKRFSAQQYITEIVPYKIEVSTKGTQSFMEQGEFREREDGFYVYIMNDSTATGLNNGDTGKVRGFWMKTKITFMHLFPQKMFDFVTKVVMQPRLFNK